jgi:hypothetical protein
MRLVVLEAATPSWPWLLSAGGSLLLEAEEECDNPPRKIPYYRLNQSTLVIRQ